MDGNSQNITEDLLATLFGKSRSTITEHISNVFQEGELLENVVCRNFRLTTPHGAMAGKNQEKDVKHYNLDWVVLLEVDGKAKSISWQNKASLGKRKLNL